VCNSAGLTSRGLSLGDAIAESGCEAGIVQLVGPRRPEGRASAGRAR